ncbi:glycoside hydrolase family 47 protein [Zasmidium cellare ATCC 36951]|uniref:alpha-1,2-Mannosidase n=1 Tax=Zasmidium cellare ATCC 36951 TaxID=1080233 RepID=A0A6A6CEE7_ZASCE|nr:glycoside hydrolase family 47 protein [Zasmidium cellare ATCC 36951]KAF2165083.1 glycoside hydrolase family 47 protein [Zasmidium cellare ATCC 36951]
MISTRRYTVYLLLAALVIFTVTRFREGIISTARIRYETFFPSGAKKSSDGKFHWSDVPVWYPVQSLTQLPKGKPHELPKIQFAFKAEDAVSAVKRKQRQAAVKEAFDKSWNAYKKHAWMKDEVTPLTAHFKNGFGGWAATLVDSLDTLWMLDMKDEFEEAVRSAMNIDLGMATMETINVFETTIRHLGGFLACYDVSSDKRCLVKAKEFGEMLLKAFDTPNRMPITRWKPQDAINGHQVADEVVLIAEIGSLTMEFTRLSQVTGDVRWYDAVDRIMRTFVKQIDDTHLPGMFPVSLNATSRDFTQDTFFTLSAMSDSFYEYFPKMHALLGGLEPIYQKLYQRSMETAIKYNLWRPMVPDEADILMSGNARVEMGKPPILEAQGQHLVCFAGGMFAVGGRLFEEEAHVKIGQKLTDGCIWTYKHSPLGVMPEVFNMMPCASRVEECKWDEKKWLDEMKTHADTQEEDGEAVAKRLRIPKGFVGVWDRKYQLRPEAIESVFILYRTTGKTYLLDAAWEMFQAIIAATETPVAYAALTDVTYSKKEVEAGMQIKMDSMESYWMAETLKYFYLIFSEPDFFSLDEWVFNTEAHPFRRPLAK